jgi:hypothetical protein
MSDRLDLDDQIYEVFVDPNTGAQAVTQTTRPSQRGDPGSLQFADWQVDSPAFFSVEDTSLGRGFLGNDWGESTDARWKGINTIGPQINIVTLSGHDGVTATNAIGQAEVVKSGDTTYAYIIRGRPATKVDLSDMSLGDTDETLTSAATTVISTKAANGTIELSIGQGSTNNFRTVTAANIGASGGNDTFASSNQPVEIFAHATDRIVGMRVVSDVLTIEGLILSGSVTMAAPVLSTVAELFNRDITPTGFAMDGINWVLGTSDGPYMLDAKIAEFFPILPELDNDSAHSIGLTNWGPIGTVIQTRYSTRMQRFGAGEPFGADVFEGNRSPIQGEPRRGSGGQHWFYEPIYNPNDDYSYLVAWRPRQSDDLHPYPMSAYPIARLAAGIESDYLKYVGTVNGVRSMPTIMGGHDDDLLWFHEGRSRRSVDDGSYTYEQTETPRQYFTELRREQGVIKDLEAIECLSLDATVTETITFGFSIDGGIYNDLAGALVRNGSDWEDVTDDWEDVTEVWEDIGQSLNGAITSPGWNRILFVDDSNAPHSWASGRAIKPRATYTTGGPSAAPKLSGPLRLYYRTRPLMVRVFQYTLILKDDQRGSNEERQDKLFANLAGKPVKVAEDTDIDQNYYVRVDSVRVRDAMEGVRADGSERRVVKVAEVTATEWSTQV